MENVIWKYFGNTCKVHCSELEFARKIGSWTDCELSSVYFFPDGHTERDIIIPCKLYNQAANLLGLPAKAKNSNRVVQGENMAKTNKKYRFSRNTILESGSLVKDLMGNKEKANGGVMK